MPLTLTPEQQSALDHPEIRALVEIIRKKNALTTIIGEQHTTQAFQKEEDLEAAFKGELPEMDDATVKQEVTLAKEQHGKLIEAMRIKEEDLLGIFKKVWVYSRLTNPTNELFEETISSMEKTEKTAVFASGLAAISATIQQFTEAATKGSEGEYLEGDKIVVISGIYGGTYALLVKKICKKTGRQFDHMPISDFLEKGLPNDTAMVFFEASSNPTLRVTPISEVVKEAQRVRALTVCDNTFTPLSIQPSELGVDFTIHSLTKYAGGKSTDLGGSVSGSAEHINKFSDLNEGERMLGGGVMAPRVAIEFLKNIEDLPERLLKASENAQKIKEVAKNHGLKARTIEHYPEFEKVRNGKIPSSIINGMVGFYFKDVETARTFVNAMAESGMGKSAVSLGATTTYYSIPPKTTHSEMPPEEQEKVGITEGLVRVSCGIEEDLVPKFEEVLKAIQ